jgi:cytochrome c553
MRSITLISIVFSLFSFPAVAAEPISSFQFRSGMHEIFRNYRGIYFATREGNTVAARAHVKLARDYVGAIPALIPDKDANGAPMDKAAFKARLDILDKTLAALDQALESGAKKEIAELPKAIFNLCAGCHREAKLKYLFRLPEGQKLIGEYMHSIAENFEMAKIYLETGEKAEAGQHIAIVNQLLSILKRIFPDKGPTGVVMSRDRLVAQIAEVERHNGAIEANLKAGKKVEFDSVKKAINSICVSCHEPDRIK